MIYNTPYVSVSRARWHHIDFNSVFDIRAQQANENSRNVVREKLPHTADKLRHVEELAFIDQ